MNISNLTIKHKMILLMTFLISLVGFLIIAVNFDLLDNSSRKISSDIFQKK